MSSDEVQITLDEAYDLARRALVASRTSRDNSASVARSIAAAESDGMHSHGLMRLPTYCDHALVGKVDGYAVPAITSRMPAALMVDAGCGFAHPAIDLGCSRLIPLAKQHGVASLGVKNSYNCGVVGYHVERLAQQGLIALAFANAPAAIAPWGGTLPVFGTNPLAFAVPRWNAAPLVIDQSSSTVARGEVLLKARLGESIPEGWGLDRYGKATTNADDVLSGGSMAPAGGYKGTTLALIVEILAAAVAGANFSFEAPSVITNEGGPPRIGQFFIALEPCAFAGDFAQRIEVLLSTILAQAGTRLPGERRLATRLRSAREGIRIDRALFDEVAKRASSAG